MLGNIKGTVVMVMVEMDLMGEVFHSINSFKDQEIKMALYLTKYQGSMIKATLEDLITEVVIFLALLLITREIQTGILGMNKLLIMLQFSSARFAINVDTLPSIASIEEITHTNELNHLKLSML